MNIEKYTEEGNGFYIEMLIDKEDNISFTFYLKDINGNLTPINNESAAVYIDMDNTVAANITHLDIEYQEGMYRHKDPMDDVIKGIKNIFLSNKKVIISTIQGGEKGKKEKEEWVKEYLRQTYNMKIEEEIYTENSNKDEVIGEDGLNSILIDDKKSVLQKFRGTSIYPSQITTIYMGLKKLIAKIIVDNNCQDHLFDKLKSYGYDEEFLDEVSICIRSILATKKLQRRFH